MLLDAIACAYYGINPSSYRRKSRKFNQHDLLRLVFSSVIESNRHRRLDLIVDCPEWTSFDNLKSGILSSVSRKNSLRFQTILDLYTCDQHMMKVGLANVIIKAFRLFAGYTSQNLPQDFHPTTKSVSLGGKAAHMSSKSNSFGSNDAADAAQRSVLLSTISPQSKDRGVSSNRFEPLTWSGLHVTSNACMHPDERQLSSVQPARSPAQSTFPALFTVKEKSGGSLCHLFGDGRIISIAAASAEDLGLILRCRLSDYEWCFESLDHPTTTKLQSPLIIRVRGYDLILHRFVEHL